MKKIISILVNTVPILWMIGLIPLVKNDYLLTVLYLVIIVLAFSIRKEKQEILIFSVGCIAMTISETVFILTGVETFVRNSLFGIMPLWLPFLWGYGFIVIARSIKILKH